MAIKYNSKKIIPAPFVNFGKSYQTAQDGTIVGSVFNFTLEGWLVPTKGSPTSSGTFWTAAGSPSDETIVSDNLMSSIIRKQEALRELFSIEGKTFQVDGWDGKDYLICNPRVKGPIRFPAGNPTSWANKCQYQIDLEADAVYLYDTTETGIRVIEDQGLVSGFKIESAEESWNIESQDENVPLFRLSHQISAKGKRFYGTGGNLVQPAWENARDYVLPKLGLDSDKLYASGVLNLTGYSGYNYIRTQNISELGGTFGVTESWIAFAPDTSGYHAYEEFDINVRRSEEGLTTVGVQGKVIGLEVRNNNTRGGIESSKYYNASGKFVSISPLLLSRAQNYGKTQLHSVALSTSIGHNPQNGIITYNYEFNNRPTANISGAISESIVLSWDNPSDVFAELTVLGRPWGPVLQSIGTVTSAKKTVTIEAVMSGKTQSYTPTMPSTNSLINSYAPSASGVFVNRDIENWDENRGRFSRTKSWTFSN